MHGRIAKLREALYCQAFSECVLNDFRVRADVRGWKDGSSGPAAETACAKFDIDETGALVWAAVCAPPVAAAAVSPSSEICAQCHKVEAKRYRNSPMAHAAVPIAECRILAEHPDLRFEEGLYRSSIRRDRGRSILTVTDGNQTLTVPLLWAFGNGNAGQTYIFEWNGVLYE